MKKKWIDMVNEKKLYHEFDFVGQIDYHLLPIWIATMDVCVAPFLNSAGLRSPVKIFDCNVTYSTNCNFTTENTLPLTVQRDAFLITSRSDICPKRPGSWSRRAVFGCPPPLPSIPCGELHSRLPRRICKASPSPAPGIRRHHRPVSAWFSYVKTSKT